MSELVIATAATNALELGSPWYPRYGNPSTNGGETPHLSLLSLEDIMWVKQCHVYHP
jgi:hypothetical protein